MSIKFKFKFKCLIAVVLLSGYNSLNASIDHVLAKNMVKSVAKSEQVEHGYWKNPNVNYVAQDVPSGHEGSIRDIPNLDYAFIDTAPIDRKDGLVMGALSVDDGDKEIIVKLAEEIADGQHGKIDSLLIAHKGKLVFESYFLGGRVNLTHPQASATKTYTGMALGRAIQLGYLSMADLDKPLVSFLKEINPAKFVKGTELVTLHQALTMRSGIRISKEQRESFDKYPNQIRGQSLVQAIFEQCEPISAESQHSFSYGNYSSTLVMQVINAVVPGTVEDFIKNELLGKMGIKAYGWQVGLGGLPAAGWKSAITSRAMLKFGTLAMNKGKYNGEQLVPEAYITKATSRILYNGDDDIFGGGPNVSDQGYGYFWWNADLKYGDKSYYSTSAQGGGGQFIIFIEELDLLVVFTGHERHPKSLQLTAQMILPAFIQDESPTLEGPYLGQKPPGLTPKVFAPGVVSTEHHEWGGFFTPDMKGFYFARKNNTSGKESRMFFKYDNNRWHEEPGVSGDLSSDGKTMFYLNQYRERTNDGWSELKSLGPAFEDIEIMRLTSSLHGTYVFDEFPRDGKGNIRYARLLNGEREAPKSFSKEINTGKNNVHPFIAPDESYILWDSERDGGYGGSDIYISFRQEDGSWGKGINLGDKINTSTSQRGGYVTPDGKYLFYNSPDSSGKGDIFWVDAQIIDDLKSLQTPVEEFNTDTTNDLIKKVETGLTTPVYIEGDSTWSIEERMKHYGIPGVSIAVIHNGEIAWTKGYGVVDKDSKAPVTEQTLFQAAATSMPVTAYGALRLVEQNKIDLDENINNYLKSWKLTDNEFTQESKVTTRNLLNHSAGIHPRGTGSFSINKKIPTLVEILNGTYPATNEPITVNKEPGESVRFAYASYVPIQQMMLDVEGKTFPEIMHELVLQPLEMNNSTFNQSLTSEQLSKAATGYLKDGSMVKGRRYINPSMATSGLWTTAEDYAKFITNVQQTLKGKSTKGLSKDLTELMGTPYGVSDSDWSFTLGLGFQLLNKNNEIYLRHHGWNRGFYAEIVAHRDKGYGVVVMTNSTFPVFNAEVMRSVAQAYHWDHYVPVHKKIEIEQALADEITGRYLSDDAIVEVFQKGSQLFYKNILDEHAEELVKVSDNNFVMRNSSRLIQFKPNSENKTINLHQLYRSNESIAATFVKTDNNKKYPVEFLLEGDFEKALEAYKHLKQHDPVHATVTEAYINNIGYDFYHDDRMKLAQNTFKVNMMLYPDNFKVYDSYAEACMKMGEVDLAILNYSKSLELNPQNNNAKDKLEELQKSR